MYGIADLDNCYCSCEKVFRPDLEGKPIVVLSNNDGILSVGATVPWAEDCRILLEL